MAGDAAAAAACENIEWFAWPASHADAKEYNVSLQNASNLKSSCTKAGGKFTDGSGLNYRCDFKNGTSRVQWTEMHYRNAEVSG